MAAVIALPALLDLRAAVALRDDMLALRGQAVTLDASAVERLGGLALQVLLSAAKTWAVDGCPLAISPASDAFADQCRAFGALSLAAATGEPA